MNKVTVGNINNQTVTAEEMALYRQLKPFIARCLNLNHDLNNPLAGIIGYAEFLQEDALGLNDEQKGYLKQVLVAAERIRAIIDDLSEMKLALGEQIDLKEITRAYQNLADESD